MLIQSFFGSRQVNPSQELDEDMLTDIAVATGGQYFRARNAQELDAIYQQLDQLEPIEGETRKMRPLTALFYFPLALALLLSALWTFGALSVKEFLALEQRKSIDKNNTSTDEVIQ
jgi:Ca-activated chloride channel family protein